MSSIIKCPSCGSEFPLQDAMTDEMQKEFEQQKKLLENEKEMMRSQMLEYKKAKDEEIKKQQQEQQLNFQKSLEEELKKRAAFTEATLRKNITSDYEHKLQLLQQSITDNEEKLKASREKEMEYLRKEKSLKEKEAELELQVQKQILMEREKLRDQVMKEEAERMTVKEQEYAMKMKEMEKQMDAQKRMIDEMKRKAEQGSMQLQGEVQEILLEDLLRAAFPFDLVSEVGKGIRGADCTLTIRNQFGNEAGTIIFESKRTKEFASDWIDKLKSDMRQLNADIAIIVTQAMPKDMDSFGEKDGVFICSFHEVRGVTHLLRNGLLKVHDARKSGENKGDKMTHLYNYLTSNEFREQWKAISEGFLRLKSGIQSERVAMEKLWKQREKQLEQILLNAAHIQGSVEGIAGLDNAVDLSLGDSNSLMIE